MRTHRYPGVKPFSETERNVFYGRTTDTKKLFQLINLEKLVLLYSKSGLGKSSLLNAGVLPLFEELQQYTTISIRFGASVDGSDSPIAKSLFKLPSAPSNPVLDKLGAGNDTLWLRMKAIQKNEGEADKTYILVFDQFEELFTYSAEEIKLFKRQLGDLLYKKVPAYISKSVTNRLRENPGFLDNEEMEYLYRQPNIKVVLSIRSDRMSQLNSLADYLPDVQKNYYELKPLDRDSAVDSIRKPAMDTSDVYLSLPFMYSTECINTILDYLTANGQRSIETFQLQTICQYAENLAIEDKLPLDAETKLLKVEAVLLGDLQNIFRTQYDRLIDNIHPIERRTAARLLIENKLIIDGNRVSLPDVVVLKEKGIDKDLLSYLHDTHHLLRSEPNTTDGISYELSHDTLLAPILKAKKEREDKDELARVQTEQEKLYRTQQEQERQKKLQRDRRSMGILLLITLIALVVAINYNRKAKRLLIEVRKEKNRADSTARLFERMINVSIGSRFEGGVVFYWADTIGTHGLIASREDLPGNYTWDEAMALIKDTTINGYNDWRLPNDVEIQKLFANKTSIRGFTQQRYWSSRSGGATDPNKALYLQFSDGGQSFDNKNKLYRVRPIRSF